MTAAFKLFAEDESPTEVFAGLMKDTQGFEKLAEFLKQRTGINLPTTGKNQSLMAGRVGPLLRRNSLHNYHDLLKKLNQGDVKIEHEFVTLMTTNTTHWFREEEHFTKLKTVLPGLFQAAEARRQPLTVWCAAASTGQEPYTLSLVIHEAWSNYARSDGEAPVKILATDINEKVLKKAANGIYREMDMKGLPAALKKEYFSSQLKNGEVFYRISPVLSNPVTFAPFNLMSPQFPFRGTFDIIFCRNVFIYFEKNLCAEIIEKMARVQKPGSLLFLGHSEVGTMKSKEYSAIAHAVFEREQG